MRHKSVAGRMMVPWHRWLSLACLSEGGGGGADDGALASLAVPCSLARTQGGDKGACSLVQQQVGGGADNRVSALLAVTGLVLRRLVYLVSEFNGCNKFQ